MGYSFKWQLLTTITVFFLAQSCIIQKRSSQPENIITGSFEDIRDRQTYKWVKIGNQVWMAENLSYLPEVSASDTGSETIPYYYVYDYNGNDIDAAKATENYREYGVLYNWPAATAGTFTNDFDKRSIQGICPPGWYLPSSSDWTQLLNYSVSYKDPQVLEKDTAGDSILSGSYRPLFALRDERTDTLKNSYNESHRPSDVFHEDGFMALYGGYRTADWGFRDITWVGQWWSATEGSSTIAWSRLLDITNGIVSRIDRNKAYGLSIRCVRDDVP